MTKQVLAWRTGDFVIRAGDTWLTVGQDGGAEPFLRLRGRSALAHIYSNFARVGTGCTVTAASGAYSVSRITDGVTVMSRRHTCPICGAAMSNLVQWLEYALGYCSAKPGFALTSSGEGAYLAIAPDDPASVCLNPRALRALHRSVVYESGHTGKRGNDIVWGHSSPFDEAWIKHIDGFSYSLSLRTREKMDRGAILSRTDLAILAATIEQLPGGSLHGL